MDNYKIHTFPNGIRLVHKQVNTITAHCGFMLDIGSRDEQEDEKGIAHFWEHMAFKGTKHRKAFHITNRLERVGGHISGYTEKEKICFHASVLEDHFEKAVDLLTDIIFNSTFPEKEINNERGVILDEISMYEDDPVCSIHDNFDEMVFGEHPLGQNILGTRESVKSFSKESCDTFLAKNLNTEKVIFSSVGPQSFEKTLRICQKYFQDIPKVTNQNKRGLFNGTNRKKIHGRTRAVYKGINQSHCLIGGLAYSLHHKKHLPFEVLVNLLGGPGMNSRLNLSIREKYGYTYSINLNYSPYTETGSFSIEFATTPNTVQRICDLVQEELKRLQTTLLGKMQLHTAKQQIMGQIAMSEENNVGKMLMFADCLLAFNEIDTLDSIFKRIEVITASQIADTATEIFKPSNLIQLEYHPE